MKRFLKSSEGFTLVELMVVVAIIGILSAVAIPNFKKYQAKSKQSEAKIQLAAVYTAEVTANSDFGTYGTCLDVMGFETVPRGHYVIGFNTGYAANLNSTQFATCTSAATFVKNPTDHIGVVTGDIPTTIVDATRVALQNSFLAGAAGSIAKGAAATFIDKWTINESKSLLNATQGY